VTTILLSLHRAYLIAETIARGRRDILSIAPSTPSNCGLSPIITNGLPQTCSRATANAPTIFRRALPNCAGRLIWRAHQRRSRRYELHLSLKSRAAAAVTGSLPPRSYVRGATAAGYSVVDLALVKSTAGRRGA
jgi:hypothetical protein